MNEESCIKNVNHLIWLELEEKEYPGRYEAKQWKLLWGTWTAQRDDKGHGFSYVPIIIDAQCHIRTDLDKRVEKCWNFQKKNFFKQTNSHSPNSDSLKICKTF